MSNSVPAAAAYHASRLPPDPRREQLWVYLTRYLSRFVPAGSAVLELGAGYCYFVNAIPAARKVAVDVMPELSRWAAPSVEARCEDATAFLEQAEPESFDFVLASNFLEHFDWATLDRVGAGIRRVLRPGGRLALIQPNYRIATRRYFDDYTHRTVFTDVSLPDWLCAQGLEVITVVPRFLPLTVKSRLGALTFLVPLYLRLPWRPLAGQMFVLAARPGGRPGVDALPEGLVR